MRSFMILVAVVMLAIAGMFVGSYLACAPASADTSVEVYGVRTTVFESIPPESAAEIGMAERIDLEVTIESSGIQETFAVSADGPRSQLQLYFT